MNAEERKKHILHCAKRLFSRHGYYQTQIADIIQEAKIARGTVYQYFKNKDDLFITLIDEFYKSWEKFISLPEGAINANSISAVGYFRHRIQRTLLFFESDNEMCNIVLRMAIGIQSEFDSLIKKFERKIINFISDDLRLGQQFKNISEDLDVELAANVLAGALFRIAYQYFVVLKSRKEAHDIDRLTEKLIALLAPGLFLPQPENR